MEKCFEFGNHAVIKLLVAVEGSRVLLKGILSCCQTREERLRQRHGRATRHAQSSAEWQEKLLHASGTRSTIGLTRVQPSILPIADPTVRCQDNGTLSSSWTFGIQRRHIVFKRSDKGMGASVVGTNSSHGMDHGGYYGGRMGTMSAVDARGVGALKRVG